MLDSLHNNVRSSTRFRATGNVCYARTIEKRPRGFNLKQYNKNNVVARVASVISKDGEK